MAPHCHTFQTLHTLPHRCSFPDVFTLKLESRPASPTDGGGYRGVGVMFVGVGNGLSGFKIITTTGPPIAICSSPPFPVEYG
jgi:hypothetical protein